jgi:hypothetical protein
VERYISIDNVCAWPNLTQMPDGAIIASIFNQPTHGGWEGDVECWASVDGGRMWTLRGVAAPHEPATNRMNVAAGLARDGSLVVLASGWSDRNTVGQYSDPTDGSVLPTWVCRSNDGARTWSHSEKIVAPESAPHIIPFGDIVQMGNGLLGASAYSWNRSHDNSAYFYVSEDDGLSWSYRSDIARKNGNETAMLVFPEGSILAAVRTSDDGHLHIYKSDDHGLSWAFLDDVTVSGQHPGHLLRLQDGRVLLTYGNRQDGAKGVGVRFSEDGGETWKRPRYLVDLEDPADLGYPASVQDEDGTIISAYYCSEVSQHNRYHMGVVRWNTEGQILSG